MSFLLLVFICHAIVVTSAKYFDSRQSPSDSCNYIKGFENITDAIQQMASNVGHISEQLDGLRSKDNEHLVKEIKEEMEEVKLGVQSLKDNTLGILERVDQLETNVKELEQSEPREHEIPMENHEELEQLKNNFFELDQKVSKMESESYKVVTKYIFKLEDFSEHKGNDDSVYSNPFFHGRGKLAYKMRIRVYAGGDNTYGVDDHISVYLQLMPGEFDDLLKWPIPGSYELRLLPQDTTSTPLTWEISFGDRIHFQKPGTPAAYHKGFTPNNVSLGCSKCFSHLEAETYEFLRSDTIYIEVLVTTDSKHFVL